MSIDAYPLQWPQGWPRTATHQRKPAKFSKGERRQIGPDTGNYYMAHRDLTISEATKRVLYELERLGVQHGNAVISTNLSLRLDGLPYSNQREPSDPGVAVYWVARKDARRVMAIDRYDRIADNLAAIAATLEAMRAIDRHGGAQILERAFTGFAALSPPDSPWDVLGVKPGASADEIRAAYVAKAKTCHPDANGSHEAMSRLNAARDEAMRQVSP